LQTCEKGYEVPTRSYALMLPKSGSGWLSRGHLASPIFELVEINFYWIRNAPDIFSESTKRILPISMRCLNELGITF